MIGLSSRGEGPDTSNVAIIHAIGLGARMTAFGFAQIFGIFRFVFVYVGGCRAVLCTGGTTRCFLRQEDEEGGMRGIWHIDSTVITSTQAYAR